MQAGRLRHYASIQQRTSSKTGDVWTEVRKQWLRIDPIGATKLQFLSAQGARVTHQILAREKPALAVGQRIVYRSQNYQITSVENVFGDRQEALAELVQ
jgi:head-tail adaptor